MHLLLCVCILSSSSTDKRGITVFCFCSREDMIKEEVFEDPPTKQQNLRTCVSLPPIIVFWRNVQGGNKNIPFSYPWKKFVFIVSLSKKYTYLWKKFTFIIGMHTISLSFEECTCTYQKAARHGVQYSYASTFECFLFSFNFKTSPASIKYGKSPSVNKTLVKCISYFCTCCLHPSLPFHYCSTPLWRKWRRCLCKSNFQRGHE